MPENYAIKLKNRKEVANGTMAFYFDKSQDFSFVAGEHITMTQEQIEDSRRVFCMASAPYEDSLIFAMRMSDSGFKSSLKTMPIGTEVGITESRGSFVLHHDASKPAVFLVGGIGVTPFRSMAMQASHDKRLHKIFMFYSNYKPEDAAFLEELGDLEGKNSSYKLIATMTEMKKSNTPWQEETGYINKAMLKKYIEDIKTPLYYIAGPPGFVLGMRGMLDEIGIDTDSIKTDQFSGY